MTAGVKEGLGLTESCGLTAGTWPSLAALLNFVGCGASCKTQYFRFICAVHTTDIAALEREMNVPQILHGQCGVL